jgi:hypothetical protein
MKRDTAPLAERIAKLSLQQDSLTLGQFDASDFGEQKLWIWAEHDLRQQAEVLRVEEPARRVRRRK